MNPNLPIRFIKRKKINTEAWDYCIEHAINAMPYAYSWYLDIVTNKKWDALVLGDYKAVFPLPYNRKLAGIPQVYHPFFAQQLGVFSTFPISTPLCTAFLSAIPRFYWRIYTQLNEAIPPIVHSRFSFCEKLNFVLPLNADYEILKKGYAKNLKRKLKKLAASILSLENISADEFLDFYKKNPIPSQKNLYPKNAAILQLLLNALAVRKKCKIRAVKDEKGNLLSAVFFVKSHDRLIYLLARSSSKGKILNSMPFLLDAIIQQYANTNYLLDFEGSTIPSIAQFFKSFGAEKRIYYSLLS